MLIAMSSGMLYAFKSPTTSFTYNDYLNELAEPTYNIDRSHFEFSGFIRNDALFNSRQMIQIGGANINNVWPAQPDFGTSGTTSDIFDRPSASIVNILPSVNISYGNVPFAGGVLDTYLSASYLGFEFGNGVALLSNAFAQLSWPEQSIALGVMPHPFMILYAYPNMVSNGLGLPITPFGTAPQIRFQQRVGLVDVTLTIMNQYLFPNNGPLQFPYNFTNLYLRNATTPAVNLTVEWFGKKLTLGAAVQFFSLQPRLFTQPSVLSGTPRIADSETINNVNGSIWAAAEFKYLYAVAQFIYGQNGTPFTNLGGYGVALPISSNDLRGYTNIRFASLFFDLDFLQNRSWFTPGLYAGYTENLGSKVPLAHDPSTDKILAYTIDDYSQFTLNDPTIEQRYIMAMLRVAPRMWFFLSENVAIGLEMSVIRTYYALVNDFFQARELTPVTSLSSITSAQYLF